MVISYRLVARCVLRACLSCSTALTVERLLRKEALSSAYCSRISNSSSSPRSTYHAQTNSARRLHSATQRQTQHKSRNDVGRIKTTVTCSSPARSCILVWNETSPIEAPTADEPPPRRLSFASRFRNLATAEFR